jgi:hypothetical protein
MVLFREEQKMVPGMWGKALWLVPILVLAALALQLVMGQAPSIPTVVLGLLVGTGLPLLLATARLVIEVRPDGVYCRYAPFHRSFRSVGADEIQRHEVRTFRPLVEYGGWGIRCGPSGRAYTVRGKRGVQLELKGGKRLMLGSQRADELSTALSQIVS